MAKLYACNVTWDRAIMTVVSPRGGDGININVDIARRTGLTIPQLDIIDKLRGNGNMGNGIVELTAEEMQALLVIRDKAAAYSMRVTREEDREQLKKDIIGNGWYDPIKVPPVIVTTNEIVRKAEQRTAQTAMDVLVPKHTIRNDIKGDINDDITLLNRQERDITGQLKTLEKFKGGCFFLNYDIEETKKKYETPDGWTWNFRAYLYMIGLIRPKKSGYAGPRFVKNHELLVELLAWWDRHNIEYDLWDLDTHETKRIVEKAKDSISREITKIHGGFIKRIDSAARTLEKEENKLKEKERVGEDVTERDYHRIQGVRDSTTRTILKSAAHELRGAIDCARLYDEEENLKDLFQGLRMAIRSEAIAFDSAMADKSTRNNRTYKGSEVNV